MTDAAHHPAPLLPPRPRWRRVLGVAVTVLAVGTSVVSSFFVFGAEGFVPGQVDLQPGWRAGLGMLAALAAAVALCWRHQHPVLITAIAVVPPLVFIADALAALIALAALASARRDHVLWIGTALVYAAATVALGYDARRLPEVSPLQWLFGADTTAPAHGQVDPVDVPTLAVFLIAAVITSIPLGVGLLRGTRRDLTHSEHNERGLLAEMTRRDERARIARDMHDVLGHRLSLLSLQAGALEVNSNRGPEQLAEIARTVRGTARHALDDLRQVIGVLRDGGGLTDGNRRFTHGDPAQPSLGELPTLIQDCRRAGLALSAMLLVDTPTAAPDPLGAAAYRIVQESLTNVLRHAPEMPAEVSVRGGPGSGLAIEIRNPLPVSPPTVPRPGAGSGLAGLAERVTALGGTLSTGPTETNDFAVAAWLPWPHRS